MAVSITFLDLLLAAFGLWLVKRLLSKPQVAPLPPGPRGLPLVGNIADLPQTQQWKTFSKWGEKYGGIVHVSALGQPMIIVNDGKIAIDMLDKKSSIYSDRPVLIMGGELSGWKDTLALTPYGTRFREYRKNMHHLMGSRAAIEVFSNLFVAETHNFLKRLHKKPEAVAENIRKTAGAIILMMGYGYKTEEENDSLVRLVEIAIDQFSISTEPGAWLVDIIPALRYIPSWFPGAGFKRLATEWNLCIQDMANIPHNMVKQQMANSTAVPSYVSKLLEGRQVTPEDEHNIKWSAASLYSGGADTTVSAIHTFFLTMTLFPEAQKKAQAEIDAVIGNDRLPTSADRERLPYVGALVSEVLRWAPVAPLGVPHRVMEDDIHEGYLIPKHSIIIPNIWQILRDPKTYSNPEQFSPERFLPSEGKAAEQDPRAYCFGFGRRICPGLNLADASVWLSCTMVLAVFNVTKTVENGVPIVPVPKYTDGTISHPEPFKCTIKARSARAEALICSD